MNKKRTVSLLLLIAFTTAQVSQAADKPANGWVSELIASGQAIKAQWYSLGSQMLSQAVTTRQNHIQSIAQKVWAYVPMEQRKQAFENRIERIKHNLIEHAAVDAAHQAYPAKLERIRQSRTN